MGELFNSAPSTIFKFQPLFSYALKDYLGPDSDRARIDAFFAELANIEDPFIDRSTERQKGILPSFEKGVPGHLVYKEVRYHHILENLIQNSTTKVIGMVRDPIAVLRSWYAAPREFRADLGWEIQDEWRFASKKNQEKPEEFFGFEKWKEVVRMFERLERKYRRQFRLVRYESLVDSPSSVIGELFHWCGIEMSDQTMGFIAASTSRHQAHEYSVFKSAEKRSADGPGLPPDVLSTLIETLRGDSAYAKYLDSSSSRLVNCP